MYLQYKGYIMAFCLIPVAFSVTIFSPKLGAILAVIAISCPFFFPGTKMQRCPYCGKKDISVTPGDDQKTCPACQKKCIVKHGNLLRAS